MSDNLPVAWLARHGETAWSLRTSTRTSPCSRPPNQVFTAPFSAGRTCTGTDDPQASDMLYINNLAAQVTGNMMPGETSIALGRHTEQDSIMVKDGGDCEDFLVRCYKAETNRKDSMHDNTNRASH